MIIFAGIFGYLNISFGFMDKLKLNYSAKGYINSEIIENKFFKLFVFSPNQIKEENYINTDNLIFVLDGKIHSEKNNNILLLDFKKKDKKEFLEEIEGSYSGLILDIIKKEIILFRDIFGAKNLFYHYKKDYLIFANDLNTLKEFKDYISLGINPQSLYDYTALFFIPSPCTFYKEIKSLFPGEYLFSTFLEDGKIEIENNKYYIWKIERKIISNQSKLLRVSESLIQNSVRKYLDRNKVYSSLLSGGIDSSIVSFYAAKYLEKEFYTFNVKFSDIKYDETWAALRASQIVGSKHFTYEIIKEDITLDKILKIMEFAGQPFGDSSLIPAYYILKMAKDYSNIVLSGEGGDEAFWLNPYVISYFYYKSLPFILKKLIFNAANIFNIFKHKINLNDFESPVKFFRYIYSWLREEEHKRLVKVNNYFPVERYYEPKWICNNEKNIPDKHYLAVNAMEILTRLNLPNDYLYKLETAGKANGIEVISPFLDKELFNLSLSIPFYYKRDKKILRKIAQNYFPKEIVKKKKWGFGIPLNHYLNEKERERARDFIYSKIPKLSDYLNKDVLIEWTENFCKEKIPRGMSAMGLYQRIYMVLSLSLFI